MFMSCDGPNRDFELRPCILLKCAMFAKQNKNDSDKACLADCRIRIPPPLVSQNRTLIRPDLLGGGNSGRKGYNLMFKPCLLPPGHSNMIGSQNRETSKRACVDVPMSALEERTLTLRRSPIWPRLPNTPHSRSGSCLHVMA